MAPKKSANTKCREVVKSDGKDPDAEVHRIAGIIEELSERFHERVRPHVKSGAPYLAKAWVYFLIALPYIVHGIQKLKDFVAVVPEKILWASVGFILCFFGGMFPATVAAAEAWHLCGGSQAWAQSCVLFEEFGKVADASKKEDAKEEDKDGTSETAELTPTQIVQKKVLIALAVMEPENVSRALSCLYTGWIGVIGVLKIQFARTITLGDVIGERVYQPASRAEPFLQSLMPEDYQKWVPTCTRWSCKLFAITVAWFVQRVISAFHSAVRGGLIFGEYLVEYLHEKGYLDTNHKDTFIDEAIGWSLAVLGFITQLACGFQLPFVMNIVLWPVQVVEAFVVWSVAS